MKNIFIITAFLVSFAMPMTAQTLEKLEDTEGVSSVIVSKEMFNLLKKFPDAKSKDMELFNSLKGLTELKIFTTKSKKTGTEMTSILKSVINNRHLVKLIRVKENDIRADIYVKSSNNKETVKEVLMLINGSKNSKTETTIISLLGDIDINKLADIAKKMK